MPLSREQFQKARDSGYSVEQIAGFESRREGEQSNISQETKPSLVSSGKDPLSFIERGKFSFGDEPGRRSFLQKKFPEEEITQLPTGKFAVGGQPVDPEGFDLGDIADVSDEIVRLGGQIIGATVGAATGLFGAGVGAVPGAIGGGAAGRGVAQAGVETIGRAFGVSNEEFGEVAKDILRESALGALGEASGIALSYISKPGIKFLQNFAKKMKGKLLDAPIRSFYQFTGDIENFALKRVQSKGANKVITKENLADKALLRVANKIQSSVKELRSTAGKAVKEQKKALAGSNKNIDIINPKDKFVNELKEADIIDLLGNEKSKLIAAKDAPRNELLKIKDTLDSFKQSMSAKQAIQLKDELDDMVKFAREGKITIGTNEGRIIKQLSKDINYQISKASPELAKANKAFSEIANLQDVLKTKLDLPAGESFVRDVLKEKYAEFPKQKLYELNNLLPKKDQFIEELIDVAAAQQFKSSTFRGIRSGIFSGLIGGAGFGVGGPATGAAGLALGASVSTPKLVGKILGAQQAVGRVVGAGAKGISEGIIKPAIREAVPAFIKSRENKLQKLRPLQ